MYLQYTNRFRRSYRAAPPEIQRAFDRQATLLLTDIRYPSLHAKKYDQANDVWQARVNRDWRFYFLCQGENYVLLDIMAHPK